MRTLITGGAGLIGSQLAIEILEINDEILILDDLSGSPKGFPLVLSNLEKVKFYKGSIQDKALVKKLMREVTHCYHLAANLGVKKIHSNPIQSFMQNIQGSEIVLNFAAETAVRTLLASSSEIYGKNSIMPLTESSNRILGDPKVARWSYSEAKAIDELLAFELNKVHGFPYTIARFFNVIGPRQTEQFGMVLPNFIKSALLDQPLIIYGDVSQTRTFCSASDVAVALNKLMCSSESVGQVYNIGSTSEISIKDLAIKVIELTNSKSHIEFKKYSEVFGDNFEEPARRVPDISKISKAIGWKPKKSLNEIILEVAEYIKTNEI